VVICLERGADCLHMVQLMKQHPKTPSSLAALKVRLVLPFWYRLTQDVLEKRPLNGCSCSSCCSCSRSRSRSSCCSSVVVVVIIVVVCGGSLAGETRWGNASAGTVADRTLILIRHGQYDLQSGQLTQLGKRTTRGGVEAVSRALSVERASVKR